jgi:hypothetical protein
LQLFLVAFSSFDVYNIAQKELKTYQIKQLIELLEQEGLI